MTNEHSLEVLAKTHESERVSFADEFPDIVGCIDSVLLITKAYTAVIIQSCSDKLSINLTMLVPRFQSYFEQSILLATEGRIDESYALLRMSTEVMRDVHELLKDTAGEAHKIYSEKDKSKKKRGKYKDRFKFNDEHGPSRLALEIYHITSKFGVHGHNMTLASSLHKKEQLETPFGNFTVLKMTNLGKMEAICLWLRAVFPLYAMLIDGREHGIKTPPPVISEFEHILREVIINTAGMTVELEQNLKSNFGIDV